MKKFLFTGIIIATFIGSCEPPATFEQPQPADTKSLSTIPERIRGDYLSADQASTLTISDNQIYRTYDFDYKVHKDSLPPAKKLIADTLVDTISGAKEIVLVKGDTVLQHVHETDTLFSLSTDNLLKQFKGYYFLNKRYGEKQWTVQKLSLKNGALTVGNISEKDDIDRLKAITETVSDTASKHFNLTRKQFKAFLQKNGFSDEETFTKIDRNTKQEIKNGSML